MDAIKQFFGKHAVSSSHEVVADGVRFNVQRVDALNPSYDRTIPASLYETKAQGIAKDFYSDDMYSKSSLSPKLQSFGVQIPEGATLWDLSGKSGLYNAAYTAYAQHRPLSLSPDDVWATINYAWSRHVQENAEALRDVFVSHQGKKALVVDINGFLPGSGSQEQWEKLVFKQFASQIRENVPDEVHDIIASPFSTSSPVDVAVAQLTLMAGMKEYFMYMCRTCSGISSITLRGSLEDWQSLRKRTEQLQKYMLPEFAKSWIPHLLPVLDQFIASYTGEVDVYFWQGFIKRIQVGQGSGAYSVVSGWVNLFYPYLVKGRNKYLGSWKSCVSEKGPEPEEFPTTVSSAPVVWDFNGTKINMHFHAGSVGMAVQSDGTVRPVSAWVISNDLPKTTDAQLDALVQQLADLRKAGGAELGYDHKWAIQSTEREIERLKQQMQQ